MRTAGCIRARSASILTPMYVGLENALDLPQASTFCNQCGVVCPVKIPLPDLQRKLREKEFERHLRPWYERAGLKSWGVARALRPALYGVASRLGVRLLRSLADRNGMIRRLPLGGGWTDERDMPAPAGRTFRELYKARATRPQSTKHDHERTASTARADSAAIAARRIARHRERIRRARRSERARARREGHRVVLHRPAGFPDATQHPGRGDRGDSRAASTATRRPRASTSCAPPRHATSARGGDSTSVPTTSSSPQVPSRSSPTRSLRSPITASATK